MTLKSELNLSPLDLSLYGDTSDFDPSIAEILCRNEETTLINMHRELFQSSEEFFSAATPLITTLKARLG